MHAPPGNLTAPPLEDLLKNRALAGDWLLDPRSSTVRLESSVLAGLIRVKGVFRDVRGNGTISPDGVVTGTVSVTAASIDTRNARRDAHLRSADFFDSADIPDITFTADDICPSDHGVTVGGALTVRNRTRPLAFGAAASVRGDGEIWLDADVTINRADFGLTWNLLGMVANNSTVRIHAVFTRR